MTYFLGLVQTTQRHTRGVSWLFITSNSPLSIFQSLHRSVVGSNTAVRDNNRPGRAGCKRKLVSWAECKFPVCSGLYFVLVWAARSPSLTCSRLQSHRGPWHGTAPDCMLSYWSRLLSICVYRLERRRRRGGGLTHSHTHMPRWRRLRRVRLLWWFLRKNCRDPHRFSSVGMSSNNVRSEMFVRAGWERGKRNLKKRGRHLWDGSGQAYRGVKFTLITSRYSFRHICQAEGGSHHRICSNRRRHSDTNYD